MQVDQDPHTNKRKARAARGRWVFGILLTSLSWLLIAIGAVLVGAAIWVRQTFGDVSIDQMLMNLPGAGGAETTNAETLYIRGFIVDALLIPLGVVTGAFLCWRFGVRRLRLDRAAPARGRFGVARRKPTPGSFARRIVRWAPSGASAITLVLGIALFGQAVGAADYFRASNSSLSMSEYYVVPDLSEPIAVASDREPSKPKNLVLIFMESIEQEMSNTELFSENLLEPVESATRGWSSMETYREYPGGGWTMAGLFGTSCGVPLRSSGIEYSSTQSNSIGEGDSSFMPGAVCLGDVLSESGYTNVFLGGADSEFASKGRFLREHGYDDVKDLQTWLSAGEDEVSNWGLSDRRLMENAKAEVTRLHDAGQPFNLTLLTVDSHEPAYPFDYCEQTTEVYLESAIRCSMEQVAGFISYLEDSGYLEDTLVILTADHKKMIGESMPSMDVLLNSPDRSLFNRFWDPDGAVELREGADQLSMYATILDLLDLGREDHRAGIGSSMAAPVAEGSAIGLEYKKYLEVIQSRSAEFYRELWSAPRDAPVVS